MTAVRQKSCSKKVAIAGRGETVAASAAATGGWGSMEPETTVPEAHKAEPAPGTFQAVTGGEADLFNLDHYPVRAVCRVCSGPIRAEAFILAFRHRD
jgi:hypothetical protein